MTGAVNTWAEKFKNPALWITILGVTFYVTIRLDKVDVLERRLEKKIVVIEQLEENIDELEHTLKDRELEFWKIHYEQELKIQANTLKHE